VTASAVDGDTTSGSADEHALTVVLHSCSQPGPTGTVALGVGIERGWNISSPDISYRPRTAMRFGTATEP
jgi:hypothetical protein